MRYSLSSIEEVIRTSGKYEVAGRARSAEEAIERVRLLAPDRVLMDLDMPVHGGIAAIREISAMERAVAVIALTVSPEETSLLPAIEAGARGYVMKNAPPQALLEAVETVLRGGDGPGGGARADRK